MSYGTRRARCFRGRGPDCPPPLRREPATRGLARSRSVSVSCVLPFRAHAAVDAAEALFGTLAVFPKRKTELYEALTTPIKDCRAKPARARLPRTAP